MKKFTKFLSLAVAAAMLVMSALPMNAIADTHAVSGTDNSLIDLLDGNVTGTGFTTGKITVSMNRNDPDAAYDNAVFDGFQLLTMTNEVVGGKDQLKLNLNPAFATFWDTMDVATIGDLTAKMQAETDPVTSETIINAFSDYYYGLTTEERAALANVTGTTGATGSCALVKKEGGEHPDELPLGLYAVIQTSAPATGFVASAPLLVVNPMSVNEGTEENPQYVWQNVLTVAPKNDSISMDKKVKNAAGVMAEETAVGVGETLDYEILVKLPVYGTSLSKVVSSITDTLSGGLDYVADSLAVQFSNSQATPNDTTIWTNGIADTNYTSDVTGRVIKVVFGTSTNDMYMDEINNKFYYAKITYKARVNDTALINASNDNDVDFNFTKKPEDNDGHITDTVKAYTFNLELTKIDVVDKDNPTPTPLKNAEFTLKDGKEEGSKQIYFVETVTGTGDDTVYSYLAKYDATAEEIAAKTVTDTIKTGPTGKVTINGLKEGDFYFTETVAPAGYNIPAEPIKITIECPKKEGIDPTADEYFDVASYDPENKITNTKGVVLPATGGVGTIVFTVVGIGLIAMAYLLVIKKKQVNK